jgi:hypothetical protein
MATYLKGVTDYIPQIQEFRPDFNFYTKALQMKQSRYDANHDKLSTLYGSLLNAPMLREQNVEARDQFFKVIEQDIHKMSSLDLSKQQNVDAASSVFNQMLENNDILKDMTWTKNWQKEHQRADAFRNCIDLEKCGGGYWDGGVQALNYAAEDFKNASNEEALNFANTRYTPYQDVMGKAMKLAKEADLNIKFDQKQGGYIVTTKNGPDLVAKPLASLFMGTLGKDPKIMEYYETKAFVDGKNWINNNVAVYGSEEAAQDAYFNEVANTYGIDLNKTLADVGYNKDNLDRQRKALEQKIQKEGTTANSTLADVYRELVASQQEVISSEEVLKDAQGNMDVAAKNKGSKRAMAYLNRAIAGAQLKNDIGQAAYTLSFKDYEQTMKVDPYAMENVRQANRLALEDKRYKYKLATEKYKFDLEKWEKGLEHRGDAAANTGILVEPGAGGVDINLTPEAKYEKFNKEVQEAQEAVSSNEKSMLSDATTLMQHAALKGDAAAEADMLKVLDAMVKDYKAGDDAFLNKYNNWNPDKKLQYAKSFDFKNNMYKLNGTDADDLYNNVLLPMLDQSKPNNRVSRGYMQQLWNTQTAINKRNEIKSKNLILSKYNDYKKEQTAEIKAKIKADSEFDDYTTAIDVFIDENGNPKDRKEFIVDYMKNTLQNAPGNSNKEAIKEEAYFQANEIYDNLDDEDEGVMTWWKHGWGKYSVSKGQSNILHGGGSEAVEKALRFPTVDPYEYTSNGTMGTNQYIRDVLKANSDQVKVVFGEMMGGIPAQSNEEAFTLINQIARDIKTKNKAGDKSRPILDVTFQNIAGGSDDWTALNIKVDDKYANQYVGSEKNKGLLYDKRMQVQEGGITLYLKKDASENMFYKNAKTTPIESILEYTGEYAFDEYPEYQDLKLEKLQNGGLNLSGNVAYDLDENGNIKTMPMTESWHNSATPVDAIANAVRQKIIATTARDMTWLQQAYNREKGVKNLQ